MRKWKRVVLNAGIVAGISFLSSLSVAFPPSISNLYAAGIAFGLTFLVTIRNAFDRDEKPSSGAGGGGNPGNPKFMMII